MKKIVFVLLTMICLPATTIHSSIPIPNFEEYFTVSYDGQDLQPIIWQEEKNGKNYLFTIGFAKISDQSPENCGNLPDFDCKLYKANRAAFFDAKSKLERFYTGRKFFQNFDIAEEGKLIDSEYVYIIGKIPIAKIAVDGLPTWLKVKGKVPLLLEGKDEYFSLGIVETDLTLKPRERLSKALKLAKEKSKAQLKNYFQFKEIRGWCVEKRTFRTERDAKSVYVLGSIPKSKKN